ncbi:Tn3 family transposase [Metabacillus sp. DBTR6]|uniref:Tn3 family transposase n=1 Tax=Metabacillus rhizolycopersici TaxID=2875709 RepID=A0ABS7UVA0_9BACI|nr:Tn3 family transposase [Metabacillus rhizolycopersici]
MEASNECDYNLLKGKIHIKVIQENYEVVLWLAHSIRKGTASASPSLRSLQT